MIGVPFFGYVEEPNCLKTTVKDYDEYMYKTEKDDAKRNLYKLIVKKTINILTNNYI